MEGDEEAGEDEEVDDVDVLVADLKLLFFEELVEFELVEV